MEDNFYRKPRRRQWFKRLVARATKNKRLTVLLALGCVLALYVLFHNKGVIARVRLEGQQKAMEQKIQVAQDENARLQNQIKALEGDKKTIEKIAREKYGMAREGETVYRVKKE
jgi:cell division protein FtsB